MNLFLPVGPGKDYVVVLSLAFVGTLGPRVTSPQQFLVDIGEREIIATGQQGFVEMYSEGGFGEGVAGELDADGTGRWYCVDTFERVLRMD